MESDGHSLVNQGASLLQAPVKMKARPAAEAEKLFDKHEIIGNSAVDRSRQISGIEGTKTVFMQLRS
jgi:hypothetical protein